MGHHLLLFTTSPPIALTWDNGPDALPAKLRPVLTNPALAKAEGMLCAKCGAAITHAGLRIAVDGAHRHILPGSFGMDQEIGCFSMAPGVALLGPFALGFPNPTAGEWRIAVCATCGTHLGWHLQRSDGFGFYGLFMVDLKAAPLDAEETSG